jgi:ADP-ribosylglycohydrolase
MTLPKDHEQRVRRLRLALDGLSVGNAFGNQFVFQPGGTARLIEARELPPEPWEYTHDTQMAAAIARVLEESGALEQDAVAAALGEAYMSDPTRGYEDMAHWVLAGIAGGLPWKDAAESVFNGKGSMGNEASVRAAPIGAYHADDLERVARDARASAEPTHLHPEGQAGAIAVAIAAAVASRMGEGRLARSGTVLLDAVLERTPAGATRSGIERARAMLDAELEPEGVASALGNGEKCLAPDTVPLALFCAARGLERFEEAAWLAVSAGGDLDTTCAIACSIAALANGEDAIPAEWLRAREALG